MNIALFLLSFPDPIETSKTPPCTKNLAGKFQQPWFENDNIFEIPYQSKILIIYMIKTLKFISDPDVTVKIEGDLDDAKAEFSSNLRKRMAATGT